MISDNIFDDVHFLNGIEKYRTSCGRLLYPKNKYILKNFNEKYYDFGYSYGVEEHVEKIVPNPKDWILVKHIIYDYSDEIDEVYGQIAIFSDIVGLKCYDYSWFDDDEDYFFGYFDEITPKKFKFKSAIRKYL